jgi:peptide/nickel transport system substrate-binding protein
MKLQLQHFTPTILALGLVLALFSSCKTDNSSSACGKVVFKTENTVNVRMEAAATSLNPILPGAGYNRYAAANIFQTLATVEPKTLEMVPLLIKKIPEVYTVTEGPYSGLLAYDFEIYDEAVWDNGSPVTAKDFLFSLKIIYHPQLPLGEWLGYFEYLRAVEEYPTNPKKFTAYFSQYYILALETLCQFPIYPAYNYDPDNVLSNVPLAQLQNQQRAQQVVAANPALSAWAEAFQSARFANDKSAITGSAAYRLESFDVDQGVTFVKKQNWWGDKLKDDNPYLLAAPDKIVCRFVKDEAPTESLIRNGELDVIPALSPAKFLELKDDDCLRLRYNFELVGANSYGRLMVNTSNPRLNDKRIRQALAHTIDYNYLINTVWQGMAERCVSQANPAKPFYARDIVPYTYDIQKAKDLLAAAGWSDSNGNGIVDKNIDGTQTEMEISLMASGASPISSQAAKSIQTTARNAGFAITIIEEDIRVISQKTRQGDYDLAITGSTLFPGLLDMYQTFHTKSIGAGNRYSFSNPEMDSLIEAIRTEPDASKRNVLYVQAQHLIHEELPEIYLYSPLQRMAVNKRFNYVLSRNRPGYYEQYFELIKQ